ncbi:putative sporulation protein YtaF [Clostridium botulinum C str. Eklund]|nr:putative sporulation protein YtaF [Clostridium botulinum C str. Eklund]NEZ50355.1 sporulation membrane protein YtaF [Clostridium botulinum]
MDILAIILFALSANLDSFTVGLSYGIKKINITPLINVLIGAITSLGTFIAMSIGLAISKFLSIKAANIIGSIMLIGIGIWLTVDFFRKTRSDKALKPACEIGNLTASQILDNPEQADVDNSGSIDTKESLALALALTINNFGLGLGASIAGLNIFLTVLFTFLSSIITIKLGEVAGKKYLSKVCGKFAPLISSIIIIIIGLYELFL